MGGQASRFQVFRPSNLHPLDKNTVIDMPEEVNMEGVDFLVKRYFLHGRPSLMLALIRPWDLMMCKSVKSCRICHCAEDTVLNLDGLQRPVVKLVIDSPT